MVCKDLSLAQQMVQVGHAGQDSGHYLRASQNLVLCEVADEAELLAEYSKLDPDLVMLIREPDLGNRATAMATAPRKGTAERKPFRHWRLWQPPINQPSHAEVGSAG